MHSTELSTNGRKTTASAAVHRFWVVSGLCPDRVTSASHFCMASAAVQRGDMAVASCCSSSQTAFIRVLCPHMRILLGFRLEG